MTATYSKPTSIPRWADTGTRTEPSSGKKDTGWTFKEPPPYGWENWIQGVTGDWIKWINERFNDGSGGTPKDDFRIVHPGSAADAVEITATRWKLGAGYDIEVPDQALYCGYISGGLTGITSAVTPITPGDILENNGGITYSASPTKQLQITKKGLYLINYVIGLVGASAAMQVTAELHNASGLLNGGRQFLRVPDANDYLISGTYIYEVTDPGSDFIELNLNTSAGTINVHDNTKISVVLIQVKS